MKNLFHPFIDWYVGCIWTEICFLITLNKFIMKIFIDFFILNDILLCSCFFIYIYIYQSAVYWALPKDYSVWVYLLTIDR